MRFIALALFVLCAACGSKSDTEPNFPDSLRKSLSEQVARVEPLLIWKCDMPSEPTRSDCSGDGMSMSGRVLLDGGDHWNHPIWNAMKASIDSSGRPWRAPDRVGKQPSNSFSRDGFMGLVEATLATGEKEPLRRVIGYAKSHGDLLCPDATDDRCKLTPSVLVAAKYALGDSVSALERATDETTILAEAHTNPPSYRSYLVMRKLNVALEANRMTQGYANSVNVLRKRYPKHLFVRFLAARIDKTSFDGLVRDLTACLAQWEKPGSSWWGDGFDGCVPESMGHAEVALAKRLLR